jgi:hypothetical protein
MTHYIWTALPLVLLIGIAFNDRARARWDDLTPEQQAQFAQLTPNSWSSSKLAATRRASFAAMTATVVRPIRTTSRGT